MRFWVQKGKNLKFSKFSTWLTSEALVALLCFLKGRKMFVSREELQTMILSTERPLCHVGELRYGPPKFFGGKPKIPENAFLPLMQVSSCSLCVTTRDNTPSGQQSQVGCKCLHTASSHCSLLLYPAISCEAPPLCVPSWTTRGVRRHQTCGQLSPLHCQHLCLPPQVAGGEAGPLLS